MQHGGQSNRNILVGDGQKLHGNTEAQYAEERQQNRLWKGHGPKSPKSSQNQSREQTCEKKTVEHHTL